MGHYYSAEPFVQLLFCVIMRSDHLFFVQGAHKTEWSVKNCHSFYRSVYILVGITQSYRMAAGKTSAHSCNT